MPRRARAATPAARPAASTLAFDGSAQAAAVQAFNLNAWQSKRLLMMQELP
jgi:hypothetical protein